MSVKNVILKKKIGGVLYDILAKTSAEQVTYENSNVATKLADALSAIAVLNGDDAGSINAKITSAIAGKANTADIISAIVASATNGALTITKNGATSDVTLKGVVTVPSYDENTRTLTLPYVGSDGTAKSVVMALGKDMVVKSGTYNSTSKKIILTLTDNSTVEIPASALVDIYTGGTTNSVAVSVSEGNEITANVRISSEAGNALQVKTQSGKEGLYVATPEAATVDSSLSTTSENAVQNKVVKAALDNKVDKDGSKVLSDNNYTTAEKTKLAGLSNYDDTALTTAVGTKARVFVSTTEPTGLTENDIWMQEITE